MGTSIEGFRVSLSPYVVTRREAELMVCPRVLFVLAAEQDISPHIVEAVRLELVHSEHHSRIGIQLMEALVWVEVEMCDQSGENEGEDPVGEENVSFVEVVHVSTGCRVLEEDGKARSEH